MNTITFRLLAFLFVIVALSAKAQISTTIFDVQFVDTNGGTDDSSFNGQLVTVTGVVTASGENGNLDAVFIQQEGQTEWAGIRLKSGTGLGDLEVGNVITVTGTVQEDAGVTVLSFVSDISVTGNSSIAPLPLDPNLFTNYSLAGTEKYEGMLIELRKPAGIISVVDVNPDDPNNFGEWLVGSAPMDANAGCRILTGRQTSSLISSLNVSYVNDGVWATNSGTMNVPAIVVDDGDEFHAIRGIMHYGSGDMKLLPRNNDDVNPVVVGVSGDFITNNTANLYPNPVYDNAVLELDFDRESILDISLFDFHGRLIWQIANNESYSAGSFKQELHFASAVQPGAYILMIKSEGGFQSIKVIKY